MVNKCKRCGAPLEGGMGYKIIAKIMYLKPSKKKPGYCNHCENKV